MLQSVSSGVQRTARASEAQALRTLNAFAVDIICIPSTEDLFWYVAQNVVGKLGFIDCVIYEADVAQTELTQVAAWGEKNPYGRNIINPLIIPFGKGISGQTAQSRQAIIVDDLLKDSNYIPDTEPARSEICVPLISGGRVVGVIDSENPSIGVFGEAELEILSTVAAMTSAKLELLNEAEKSRQRYEDLTIAHAALTEETQNRKALEIKLSEARKQEAIGRLTGRFAHEFNNLLTIIAGNVELLSFNDPNADQDMTLNDIKVASERGAQLISDMLAFAQRARLSSEIGDINTIVAAFCDGCAVSLGVQTRFEAASDLWPVAIDAVAVENMLFALTLNSIAAAGAPLELRIETRNVFHTLPEGQHFPTDLPPGRYVRVSIVDQGEGIDDNVLPQIFDPFFTTKGVGKGTGLGLSMVLGVMQQMGGTVAVRSKLGEGSRFELYFPAMSEPEAAYS